MPALSALTDQELQRIDAYWRAANYLSVGQIYLLANPLLTEPSSWSISSRDLLGHWGTTPGLNFHVRARKSRDFEELAEHDFHLRTRPWRPGRGGELMAGRKLHGALPQRDARRTRHAAALPPILFSRAAFPATPRPETPGSIHEGGELGYSLLHAYGAVFDNPSLIACCPIGDGEAETGALAASWHSNKFLNPVTDGAVIPILHLNGYKIAGPTVLARIPREDLASLLTRLRLRSGVCRRA